MFSIFRTHSTPLVDKTPLSRFVHDTSSAEKKKVYKRVIVKATADQKAVIDAAAKKNGKQSQDKSKDGFEMCAS